MIILFQVANHNYSLSLVGTTTMPLVWCALVLVMFANMQIHVHTSEFISTIFLALGESCTNGDVRLVDGASDNEGRIEYCYDGYYTPVCSITSTVASVICKTLGYTEYSCKGYMYIVYMMSTTKTFHLIRGSH